MLRNFFLFLFIAICQFSMASSDASYSLYLFVYTSEQTQSGAGHISMAFGTDTSNLTYYTKYRAQDGGGFKVKDISYSSAFNYDFNVLKHQDKTPSLVLKLKVLEPDLYKLEQLSDHWNIDKPWSLFINNCTDAVKRTLRATKTNPGLAFLISTPNELIEDLYAHHLADFNSDQIEVVYGNLDAYLYDEPNAVPQTLFGKRKIQNRNKEAIVILTGFGSKYHSLTKLKQYFSNQGYDVYVPDYISRFSLEKTVANFDKYYRQRNLVQYEKIHVFAYIVGAWSINSWLELHPQSNIKSIVYDRSTLQERAPYILIQDLKFPNQVVFGPIMKDLHQTPYLEVKDSSIRKGLLLETYATAIVRKHQETAAELGPYCWEPACFGQNYLDFKYVALNHDQMYTHPEIFGQSVITFFQLGHFGNSLDAVKPVADPFIKHKP
ncbi:MAG: hypothetical protein ACKOWW_00380 [Flavobacteriales bacterium]